MVKAYRSAVPRPDRERELASSGSGSGPVKSRQMSPEELEDYRARNGYKEQQAPKALQEPKSVENAEGLVDKRKNAVKEIDKQEVIKLIAEGFSYRKVEEAIDIPFGTLRYRLGKMGLLGLDQIKAKELLGIKQEPVEDRGSASLQNYEQELARWQQVDSELSQTKLENEKLKKELSQSKALHEAACTDLQHVRNRCFDYEAELKKWDENDSETNELLSEITTERDQRERELIDAKQQLAEMTEDRDNWQQAAQEAKQAIIELQAEYNQQPSVIVAPVKTATDEDNVNSPSHYTQGGVETIDFIRAKLTPEEFEGYCKGNILKYVSRASHKGGHEDLQKAGKYIEFAVRS